MAALPVALILLTAGLIAPAAEGQMRTAVFKAKIKGKQVNVWRAYHRSTEKCDPSFWGSGRETVRFRSGWTRIKVFLTQSARLHAFGGKSWESSFMRPSGRDMAGFKVRGTVARSSQYSQPQTPPECAVADGDGTWVQPRPDCGRRTFKGRTLTTSRDYSTGFLTLQNVRGLRPNEDRYENCLVFGWAWPTFLQHDDRRKVAGTPEPADLLLKRRLKKIILIGRGKTRHTGTGIKGNTKIEWSMTLRRIR